MNTKQLLILGLVTVVVLVAAIVAVQSNSKAAGTGADAGKLFPDLSAALNSADAVEIADKEGAFRIERIDGDWGLAERGGYPVQFERVKQNLVALAELEILEVKTKNPARHAELQLQDVSQSEVVAPSAGVVGSWDVFSGSTVEAGDALTQIDSDGVATPVSAPSAGVVAEIVADEGDEVAAGDRSPGSARPRRSSPCSRAARCWRRPSSVRPSSARARRSSSGAPERTRRTCAAVASS